jgi:hypothetical protein
MNIEEIAIEIKNTENILNFYSNQLKTKELYNNNNNNHKNSNTDYDNKNIFRDLIGILEMKTEYLFELKKKYNFLYKELNNI